MFPIGVFLLFDGLHDEIDCRHHGEANDCQEKQYLSRFAEHVFLHRWKVSWLKIISRPAGTTKLPFRKLNSNLSERWPQCAEVLSSAFGFHASRHHFQ
jgi:hypothetical protein